jgi:hypothetical protein
MEDRAFVSELDEGRKKSNEEHEWKPRMVMASIGEWVSGASATRSAVRTGYPGRRFSLSLLDARIWDAAQKARSRKLGKWGQGVSLMCSLYFTSYALAHYGEYEAANMQFGEFIPLATEKNAAQWSGGGITHRGFIQALTGTMLTEC